MADKKISQLSAASTPLAGTEVLPIVQGGATVKVSAADVTAGRAISASTVAVTGSTAPANGVYLPAANTVGISTNSTAAVYINASGNVSIAEGNAPTQALNVYRSGSTAAYLAAGNSNTGLNGTYFGVDTAGNAVINQTQALNLSVSRAGVERIGVIASETVVNESGADLDFRVEGDTNTHCLFVDASADRVGVNNNAPTQALDVTGSVKTSADVIFGTSGKGINDTNGNELFKFTATASAVNELTVANAATGAGPTISATGGDTDVSINVTPKGAGGVNFTAGNINLTSTAQRIVADFSNATIANRAAFQTSSTNSATVVNVLPNGTSNVAAVSVYSNSDPTNSSSISILSTSTAHRLDSGQTGTGSYLPVTIFTGGAERFRVDTNGNVIVNTAAIATNATNGFLYVPSCAGTPTGTPTAYTGRVPIVVDTTNNKLYFYSNGAWRDAGP